MQGLGVIGPYRLVRRLGAGGMGEVFLAYDERLERHVAIKRLSAKRSISPLVAERFRREAQIAARLNHPAIVQIHDVVRDGESDCIVMEYVAGETLRKRLAEGLPSLREALDIAWQVAQGMAEAQDQGVIHRDLKSENVLLTHSGQVKITDFGIAKLHGEDSRASEGSVVGTYRAMSPEQAQGRSVDHRSDLFSFGILLYELVAGSSPFLLGTPQQTIEHIVHGQPRPLHALRPEVPSTLEALLDQLLAKAPLLRPRDFHEVAEVLAELAGEAYRRTCCTSRGRGAVRTPIEDDTLRTGDSG
ncbi:serine/threonine protein kinase [Haliangium ochraceum DSM 14365]|uniref:Serine/threonine protein kinase n=1 Tax=Haliangium ochraceum (strain DSM 14365 / JCM 11303 / SMP-2) TaxID=502025 RepID=D0LXS3_HALO1|nr:serine/threonine protein kinase [Haliangium ochraceum DSM 14365]